MDERSRARYQRDLPPPTNRSNHPTNRLTGADRLFGSATVPKTESRRKPDDNASYSRNTENANSLAVVQGAGPRRNFDRAPSYRNRDTDNASETVPTTGSDRRPDSSPSYRGRGTRATDFIPFENDRNELDSIASGPSLTESERRVFQQLRTLDDKNKRPMKHSSQEVEPPPVQRAERKTAASGLDAILDAALSETPTDLTDEDERRGRRGTTHGEKPPVNPYLMAGIDRTRQVREIELKRITALIDGSKTDHEIWKILEESILGPIARLGLDAVDQPTRGISRKRRQKSTEVSVETQLETIGPNLAPLLSRTANALRTRFRNSSLLIALIPRLRQTGPSAFALGATTALYNDCLNQLVYLRGDYLAVADLVVEMEREVIPFDKRTAKLLGVLIEQSNRMRTGRYGEAAQSFAYTERMKKAIRDIVNPLNRFTKNETRAARMAKTGGDDSEEVGSSESTL